MKIAAAWLSPEKILLVFVVLVFVMGGGARGDIQSLIILRPLAMVFLVYAVLALSKDRFVANRSIVFVAAAWAGLSLVHLIPLPPQVWHALPNRELAVAIDEMVGLDTLWRPLSVVPSRTLNALLSLSVPLACLLMALNLDRNKAVPLVALLTIAAFASAVVGLLQVIGGGGNAFYLYRVTNDGSAVGLFANRNHNAMLLAIGPALIAACAALFPVTREAMRGREWLAAGIAILLIPFILVTQSRAGILLGFIGLVAAWWVYIPPLESAQRRRQTSLIDPRIIAGTIAALALVGTTFYFTSGNAIERVGRSDPATEEIRFQIWGPTARTAIEYLPFGSGIGTFVEAYQVAEPAAALRQQYINHAHNDLLEVLLTGGFPAIAILAVGAFIVLRRGIGYLRTTNSSRQEIVIRRLGATILLILVLGSAYDYPLRTPTLAMVFALGVAFFAGGGSRMPSGRSDPAD